MRILIVGTVPPPADGFSRNLAEVAAGALANGDEVDVLSPDVRSAAHLHASLGGLRLAVHLVARARRYDALVLRIEPGLPLGPNAGRLERAACLGALGLALGLWRDVTLRLDSPMPLPGGVGGRATSRMWRSATRIVVDSAEDQVELSRVPGIGAVQVATVAPVMSPRLPAAESWAALGEEPSREAVLGLVRAAALKQRSMNTAQVELGRDGPGPLNVSIFAASGQHRPRATGLARLAYARARHLGARLLERA